MTENPDVKKLSRLAHRISHLYGTFAIAIEDEDIPEMCEFRDSIESLQLIFSTVWKVCDPCKEIEKKEKTGF